jgi:predicted DNA-binding protein (MmcQ/YjbR family)
MLPELDGIIPAPYLARAKWVRVTPGSALSDEDITAYIAEGHRLVSGKLPLKVKRQIGLI